MVVDEPRRRQLLQQLAVAVGSEAADTMSELLPAAGPADPKGLDARMGDRLDGIDRRLAQLEDGFEQVDERFEHLDRRFEQVETRLERLEAALQGIWRELVGLHGELTTAVAGRTRAMLLAILTAVVGTAVVSLSLARIV